MRSVVLSVVILASDSDSQVARPAQVVKVLPCEDGISQLQPAPRGPFVAVVFCNGGLGSQIGIAYMKLMPAPWVGPWRLADRFWQEPSWAGDVTSIVWSASGRHLYVGSSSVYGAPALFELDAYARKAKVLLKGRTNQDITIEGVDPNGHWLDVVLTTGDLPNPERRRVPVTDTALPDGLGDVQGADVPPNKRVKLTKREAFLAGTYPRSPFFIQARFAAYARCSADPDPLSWQTT